MEKGPNSQSTEFCKRIPYSNCVPDKNNTQNLAKGSDGIGHLAIVVIGTNGDKNGVDGAPLALMVYTITNGDRHCCHSTAI